MRWRTFSTDRLLELVAGGERLFAGGYNNGTKTCLPNWDRGAEWA